jgi:cell division septum initiation protein DivIVA
MTSKIEQVIDEIEAYIAGCKPSRFNPSNVVVNRDHLEELLMELRMKTPEEIKRYQKIINNKEEILADAKSKADAMIAEAEVHTTELVSEHQIMQQAIAQANEYVAIAQGQAQDILDKATNEGNEYKLGAIQYTGDMLENLENIISHAMETTRTRTEGLLGDLKNCYDIVNTNRSQLLGTEEEGDGLQEAVAEAGKKEDVDVLLEMVSLEEEE